MKDLKIAVVGATGNVGQEMLNVLAERKFPASEIVALASTDSIGKAVSYGFDKTIKIQALDNYDFTDTNLALFSPGAEISRIYAQKAAKQGCIVIDNTSCFRLEEDVPLIVPEVNINEINEVKKRHIIANPNCSVIQLAVAINPLHEELGIKRLIISTYQSVSGAGRQAMDELFNQTKSLITYQEIKTEHFSRQIAFNLIPQIDDFCANGYTKEEMKMANEINKILGSNIKVSATCVRVPVFFGHSLSVTIEFEEASNAKKVRKLLEKAPGILVIDDPKTERYATPRDIAEEDAVCVSRIRDDLAFEGGVSMWIVADNIRKGAALNAVQIAEELLKKGLVG